MKLTVALFYFVCSQVHAGGIGDFATIPAGKFLMGSRSGEPSIHPRSEVQHAVTITKKFDLQTTEVTQHTWVNVMGENPSAFKKKMNCPQEHVVQENGIELCPNHPVEQVTWYEVKTFISKLNSMQSDFEYRLPTEAEWELAARAGTQTMFHFGNDHQLLGQYGFYTSNSRNQTHSVKQKLPNQYDLYDMHGNVFEWVEDGWVPSYETLDEIDPIGLSGDSSGVAKGGSFLGGGSGNPPEGWRYCRPAHREPWEKSVRFNDFGFRLVRKAKI